MTDEKLEDMSKLYKLKYKKNREIALVNQGLYRVKIYILYGIKFTFWYIPSLQVTNKNVNL